MQSNDFHFPDASELPDYLYNGKKQRKKGKGRRRHLSMAQAQFLKCRHCGMEFSLDAPGTQHRNHCPYCLFSVHLDDIPGDRNAGCKGRMEPISIAVRKDGEWLIIHRCLTCNTIKINRIAGDDDERALLAIAIRPLSLPPFPLFQ